MKKIIIYNIFFFLIFYIILEIITGNFIFKNKLDCIYLSCDREFSYNFSTPNGKIKNKFKKDEWGFRGRKKEIDKIDIITVGGSTTNQKFIPLEKTWPEKLEQLFNQTGKNIDIVNAGIDGQSTKGHIWNFNNWFYKIKDLKTKYIIFYIGINEELYLQNKNFPKKLNFKSYFFNFLKKNDGITYKIYKEIIKKYFYKNNVYIGHFQLPNMIDYKKPTEKIIISLNEKKSLEENLKKIIYLSKKMNAEPIFVTQKSLRGVIINSEILSIDNRDFFHYENNIAKIIIDTCKSNKIKCVDLNKEIIFEQNDFYDLIHTNEKGADKIAKIIFRNLKELEF